VVVLQGESVSRQAPGHTQDLCAPCLSSAQFQRRYVNRGPRLFFFTAIAALCFAAALRTPQANAQQRREREPNIIYAERRAQLAAQADGPIILWGFTGREEVSQANVFAQEENFYYLTGHNEEGAGLIIFPAPKHDNGSPAPAGSSTGPHDDALSSPGEMLFLPAKDPAKEKWNGVRMSPTDPDITARTGFATVKPFAEMRAEVEKLAKIYPALYTILPYEKELGGFPHEKQVVDWLQVAAPQAKVKDIRQNIYALREIKSPGEIAFIQKAIELSLDAQLEAMKMMRPGLYEYQIAAKMVEVHAMGGSEAEGYAPIVGAGPNSVALHYDKLSRKIEDGDIVVLDVGAQYSGYSADITRTLPANGKYTARQREIYEIVLGAQNAAMATLKPGMDLCKKRWPQRVQSFLRLHQLAWQRPPWQIARPVLHSRPRPSHRPRRPRSRRVLRAIETGHGHHHGARHLHPRRKSGRAHRRRRAHHPRWPQTSQRTPAARPRPNRKNHGRRRKRPRHK